MTDVEKRRLMLLQETRRTYSEKNAPPAIHPRYKSVYNSLYVKDEEQRRSSTFGIRLLISILIVGLYFVCCKQMDLGNIDSQHVVNEIKREQIDIMHFFE